MMRTYAETPDCRRRVILELLGEHLPEPCGNCDNCAAGESAISGDGPYALGQRVRHPEWGEGLVQHYESGAVVVLFETVGYKTLSLDVIAERDLLRPA
jgi:ATP-dependent DNA helicase RecQ